LKELGGYIISVQISWSEGILLSDAYTWYSHTSQNNLRYRILNNNNDIVVEIERYDINVNIDEISEDLIFKESIK